VEDVTFARYDTADYLKTEADIAAYLEAVMVEGSGDNPTCIARAMKAVARARKRICIAS
jgi:DNA-binding phage protein